MKRISLQEKARFLEGRKAALGLSGQNYVAVNLGSYRTESKRALLRAIETSARKAGAGSNRMRLLISGKRLTSR
jgi:hypothetical protein